jgi:hypothetical protein
MTANAVAERRGYCGLGFALYSPRVRSSDLLDRTSVLLRPEPVDYVSTSREHFVVNVASIPINFDIRAS